MSTYNFAAVQAAMEQHDKEQAERATLGIEGIYSNFYVEQGKSKAIRFLTPFDFGLIYFVHVDWRKNAKGKNRSTHFLCESNFSQDPMAYCPICQARKDHEHMGEDNPVPYVRKFRNYLIYDHSAEGQTYEYQGQYFPESTLGIYKVMEGGWQKELWNKLKYLDDTYNGLNNVVVGVTQTDITMFVDPYNGYQETFTQNPSTFDMNIIPEAVRAQIPRIQRTLDLRNEADGELMGQWATFLERAGGYRRADKYKIPDPNHNNMPVSGAPSYASPAPPNAQGTYGDVPFHTPGAFAPGLPHQAAPQLPPPPPGQTQPAPMPVNNMPPALPAPNVAPPPPTTVAPPVQPLPPVPPPAMPTAPVEAYTAPQNPPPSQPPAPVATTTEPTAVAVPPAPDAPQVPIADVGIPEAKKPWN